MGVTRLERLCRTLIRDWASPPTTPAALVAVGDPGRASGRSSATLADLPERVAEAGLGPPALLVVGEVVARRPALTWFEELPLFGQRIVVTRPVGEADRSAAELEALGAEVLVAPTVEIRPLDDFGPLDRAIGRLGAVRLAGLHLGQRRPPLPRPPGGARPRPPRPGPPEARRDRPGDRRGAGAVPPQGRPRPRRRSAPRPWPRRCADRVAGRRVLLARADRGRTVLKDELERVAHVEQVAVYRNVDAEALPPGVARADRRGLGRLDHPDQLGDHRAAPRPPARGGPARGSAATIRLASLSPVTTAAAGTLGWPVAAEATRYTWDGLVQALTERVDAERHPTVD